MGAQHASSVRRAAKQKTLLIIKNEIGWAGVMRSSLQPWLALCVTLTTTYVGYWWRAACPLCGWKGEKRTMAPERSQSESGLSGLDGNSTVADIRTGHLHQARRWKRFRFEVVRNLDLCADA